jgi:heptosyltransferase-2
MSLRRVLIRMPNWIGDAVMASALLQELIESNQYEISLCGKPHIMDLFKHHPSIEECISLKGKYWDAQLNSEKYTDSLLLPGSFSSAALFFLRGIPNRTGFSGEGRDFMLTHGMEKPHNLEQLHLVKVYKKLLVSLDVDTQGLPPKIHVSEEEQEAAYQLLSQHGYQKGDPLIGINPGAAYGDAKCWPPESFRGLVQKLCQQEPPAFILVFGTKSMQSMTKTITDSMPENVLDLAGKTSLRELMAMIFILTGMVSNDSGPMHIAAALNTPLVALFGSTNPQRTRPYESGRVLYKNVHCSPCYKKTCPIDFRCMKQITPEEVCNAIKEEILCSVR